MISEAERKLLESFAKSPEKLGGACVHAYELGYEKGLADSKWSWSEHVIPTALGIVAGVAYALFMR